MARKHRKGKYEFPTIEEFIEGLDSLNGLVQKPKELTEYQQIANFVDESLAEFFTSSFSDGLRIDATTHKRFRQLMIILIKDANGKELKIPFVHYLDSIFMGFTSKAKDFNLSMRFAFLIGWVYGKKGG